MVSQGHMAEIGATLSQFRQENFLCDTVLQTSDKQLKAHSVLLAAVSPVFKSAFESSGTAGMYHIDLPDIQSVDLEIALHFIYTGTLVLPSCYTLPGELPKLFDIFLQLGLDLQQFDGREMKFERSDDHFEINSDHNDKLERKHETLEDGETKGNDTTNWNSETSGVIHQGSSESVLNECSNDAVDSLLISDNNSIQQQKASENCLEKTEMKSEIEVSVNNTDEMVYSELSESKTQQLQLYSEIGSTSSGTVSGPKYVDVGLSVKHEILGNQEPQVLVIQLPMQVADIQQRKQHACPTCGKLFACKAILDQHQLVHTGEKPHICNFCNKAFSMKSNLERHEKRHTGIRPHLCELCGKGFIQKTALQYHMHMHQEEMGAEIYKQGEVYSCSMCVLTFNRSANLRKHVQKVHLKQPGQNDSKSREKKSLLCDLCGKGFASVNSLKLHKMQHTGEKPFMCSMCDKAFVVKAQLQYHARLHTGEKPFVCQICGKGFVGKLGLTQHVRTHTGERPYICTVCNKGFTQSTHLKGHMRSHTGEKPNICHICGKAYKNRLDLRFHYSRIHAMNITRPKQQIVKIE